ncbi:MAG: CDP-alcohol phosphatidyltransferase family protein [Actinomycetota bacterium]|nr:CDP-alcohol phosphatidyltransferase family protein [Actinomycetota bacterium]
MLDGSFRRSVDRCARPFGAALVRTGISPDVITAIGLAMSLPTAWAVGSGRLLLGLALLVSSALPDLLDGALAKASGRATARGAFFDSVADRVSDAMVLGGFAWYLQDRYGGHAFVLPLALLGASLLVSYERAKAESLGFDAKGGLMERAERIVVLCVGLALSPLLVPLLWAMLAATLFTAAQRFVKVWRQASAELPSPAGAQRAHARAARLSRDVGAPEGAAPAGAAPGDGSRVPALREAAERRRAAAQRRRAAGERFGLRGGERRRRRGGERFGWPGGERQRRPGAEWREAAIARQDRFRARWRERRVERRSGRGSTAEANDPATSTARWRTGRRD